MKKTPLFIIILSAAVALTLTACASNTSSGLSGTSWQLTAYGPKTSQSPALPNVETNLTLNADGTLGGRLGCNSMGGEYSISGQTITFKNIYATEMACDEPRMQQEGAAFAILQGATTYKVDGDTLTITSTNGNDALTFTAIKTQ